ncbi:Structural maintenance of chromosomes protein 5 [Ancistrocladus abbreviatus]
MDEPRAKRPKIIRGEDDYLPGNITEIELHNFMTFNHLKCKPGSRLNLVIGPNGSGKSSLVCAIALGLGGDPQLLGRATNVGAYVKRGEESGYIRITLRGHTSEEQIKITRKIDMNNKSEWLLNGKMVPKKYVIEIIQKFNIQVDNMTQFLPQDRVCEFAKLTPVQLLRETEKAVGDPQLPIQHEALIEKSYELGRLQTAVGNIRESLNREKALNAEQERDVERVRQREELLAQVELMRKKLPWLKYDMKKAEYMEAKEKENDAKKKLDEAAKTLNDLREPIEKQKQEKSLQDSKCKKLSSMLNDNAMRRRELQDDESRLEVQVCGMYSEIDDLKRQKETRQQRIIKAKEDLVAAELELADLPTEPPKDELETLRPQILDIEDSLRQTQNKKLDQDKALAQKKGALKQVVDRVKDMENKNTKLLHALRNTGAEKIFEAYHWLQEHRHQLNREVYGPVLLEVNVSNQSHADYLEGHVARYIWKSFITQDPSDRDFLVKHMKTFDVPIVNYVPDEDHRRPPHVSDKMRMLGVYSRLDQVFDAPDPVKDVLVTQFGLDNSYIGSLEADQRADELSSEGISDLWTPENHYRWSVSRYGGHVSASVDPVAKSNLLSCGSDSQEIKNLRSRKKELEDEINTLEQSSNSLQISRRQLENEAAKLHRQREEIINNRKIEVKKRRDIESLVVQRRRILKSLEKEEDVDTMVAKLADKSLSFNIQRFKYAVNIKNLLLEALVHKWTFSEKHLSAIEIDSKIRESEFGLKQQEKFALQASLHLQNCKKEVDHCRNQLADAKRFAESVALITPDLEKAFLEMPSTIEELDAAIDDTLSQASSILLLNQNILAEYEERQRKIEALARKLEQDESKLNGCLADVDALKGSWLPTLRNLVTRISATFSRNFQEMAVAGEVLLDEHDTDFGAYGILIKVKFRESGQLQVLSAHHQSGGERSVSTILYLVSLQDLTNCPFRVVDEINQGMDPINERKMFQQLVRAASQPNTPQCFLLTPKLLPDLEYSDACSVLNIMNGPWIEQPSKVWSNGESWGMVSRLLAKSQS